MLKPTMMQSSLVNQDDEAESGSQDEWGKPVYISPKITSYSAEQILERILLAQIGEGLTSIYMAQQPFKKQEHT